MRTRRTLPIMMLGTALILACMLAPASGIATEPSVNEQLVQAVKNGDLDQVMTLPAKGADVNAEVDGRPVLIWAVDPRDWVRVWPMLKETVQNAYRKSVNLDLVKLLVDQGADVNTKDSGGYTALACAAQMADLATVKFLVEQGVDVNTRECRGRTALMGAVQTEDLPIVRFLVDRGADVNARGRSCGNTTARCGRCEYAVATGLNLWTSFYLDPQDHTALMLAAESGNLEIMEFLIDKGADMNVKGESGFTALLRAAQLGRPDVAKLLIREGADLNVRDKKGKTALIEAAGSGNLELVKHLIDEGADVNVKDEHDRTALSYAYTNDNAAVVQYLKAHGAK